MADTKISALTVLTAPAAGDLIPIVDISDTTMAASGTTKSVTQSVLLANHLPLAGGTMTGAITGGNGTLVASAPMLNLAQTWNNAAVDFTALNLNVTNTASLGESNYVSGSSLFKLMVGGVNKFRVERDGSVWIGGGGDYNTTKISRAATNGSATIIDLASRGGGTGGLVINGGLDVYKSVFLDPQSNYIGFGYGVADARIYKDDAGTLAQRNGANAQTSRVYGTYTDASNYVRASLSSSATAVTLAAETAGTGADDLNIVLTPAGTGGVGIGTSPSYLLHVNTDSAGKPGTGGLWTVVSDERIKTDIVPADLSRCYDIVKQVGLKHFGFKPGVYSDKQINDKHSLGWIAQDVQKVFGKAVSIKPFTLQTDIPDGTEEYEEQEFTVETVNKVETSIEVINGKPVQASKTTQVEEKTLLFDEVVVVDVAGDIVMVDGAPLTHKVPRMVTKTRPKVRREVIEDCLDLNGGQMNAALYGAVQCLMSKVEAQAVIIASLQASVAEQAHS